MQWSFDRNGGFSRADPARLYLPPIMDPVYGFEAVNVEAQTRSPSSLLNWVSGLSRRVARGALSAGYLRFLYPSNRKVIAYMRAYGDESSCVSPTCRALRKRSNWICPSGAAADQSNYSGAVPFRQLANCRISLHCKAIAFTGSSSCLPPPRPVICEQRHQNSSRW